MHSDVNPFLPESLLGNAYLDDVRDQPRALGQLLKSASQICEVVNELSLRDRRRIILTGMGSSHLGTYSLWRALVAAGIDAWRIDTAELLDLSQKMLRPGDILWVTSQSGQSGEIVQLLETVAPGVTTVGVTNSPTSALAKCDGPVILLDAGPESTVSAKSLINTLAVSRIVAGVVTGTFEKTLESMNSSVSSIENYLASFSANIGPLVEFGDTAFCLLAGRGEAVASAQTGALILKESAKLPAEGMSGGDLRHGVIEIVDTTTSVIFFDHGHKTHLDQNLRLATELSDLGARVGWVGDLAPSFATELPHPDSESCDPLMRDVLAFQTLSFAVAHARGVEAGTFRAASKITSVL